MQIRIGNRSLWVNFHHLYYFWMIAREGSMSKAAQQLRIGQPTLSAQLRNFEQTLGVTLFDRQHKKLIMNEAGRVVLKYASEIFRVGTEMVETLQDGTNRSKIHLQVGALDSIPKTVSLALLQSAQKIAPCTVTLLEGHADELIRELMSHRIDLLITNHLPLVAESNKLISRRLAQNAVHLFGAPAFKHLKKQFPQSLQNQPMVLPTLQSRLRMDLDHFFRLNGIHVDIVAEAQDTALQKSLGAAQIGVIPAPYFAVSDLIKQGQLIDLGILPGVYEELYLVTASRKINHPIADTLIKEEKLLKQMADTLSADPYFLTSGKKAR